MNLFFSCTPYITSTTVTAHRCQVFMDERNDVRVERTRNSPPKIEQVYLTPIILANTNVLLSIELINVIINLLSNKCQIAPGGIDGYASSVLLTSMGWWFFFKTFRQVDFKRLDNSPINSFGVIARNWHCKVAAGNDSFFINSTTLPSLAQNTICTLSFIKFP